MRASERDSTGVFQTTDDSAFTDTMSLVSPYDAHIYAMSMNADSVAFASTFGRDNLDTPNELAIYRRRTDGSWWRVKSLGTANTPTETGVWDMTAFDSNGYAYYSDRENVGVYKFRDIGRHTVGTGGRYATIADALAATAPGDTLVLLAGSHAASDANVHHGMTIMGATGIRDDVTVMCAGGTHDGFICDSTAVFRDFTMRNAVAFNNAHYGLDCDFATTDLYCYNIRFAGMTGAVGFCGLSNSNNPNAMRYNACVFDSCASSQAGYGYLYAKDPAVFVLRDCIVTNNTGSRPLSINQTADGDGGAADTLLVTGCLFVGNRATTDEGGALWFNVGQTCEYNLIEHCTFVDNECAIAAHGQVFASGADNDARLWHCVITGAGSTNAIRTDSAEFGSIQHCNSWGNASNYFGKGLAGTGSDTLHVAPQYNRLEATASGYGAGAEGVWRCKDNSYMGWWQWVQKKQVRIAAVAPPAQQGRDGCGRIRRGRR